MSTIQQVHRRLVPCPVCLRLVHIEEWKVRMSRHTRKQTGVTIRVRCREHGLQALDLASVPELLKRRA